MPVSPTSTPLKRSRHHDEPLDRVRKDAVARPGHRVHADEQRRVDALFEVLDVLGPLVLHDELAVGIELLRDQRVERPALACAVAVHDDDLRRARRLRAADGRVDLAGVEAAALLVHRVAARHLLPLDDAGDSLHIGDDEDFHGAKVIAPTSSSRLLLSGVSASSSISEHVRERRADRAVRTVLGLQRDPTAILVRRAEEPFGAALRDPAGRSRIRSVSIEPREPPTSSGRARIAARIRGGVRVRSDAAPLERR